MLMSAPATISLLKPLLKGVEYHTIGDLDKTEITGLCSDSRKVQPGNLFTALAGLSVDGHRYLSQAVAAGCSALLVNQDWRKYTPDTEAWPQVAIVEVSDTKTALGNVAANYYGHPERQLTVIGVTGTNGKTTTTFLVESLLKACGRRTGVIGTVNYRYNDKKNRRIEMAAPFTTPESPALFALLRKMADEDVTDVVMEVSSHALAQSRLSGMAFDIGVFTNLSRDHLDFHPDMHHYFSSKKLLFTNYLKAGGRIVIVLDDAAVQTEGDIPSNNWGKQMHEDLRDRFKDREDSPPITTCGMGSDCDIHPQNFSMDITGISSEITTPAGTMSLKTPLVGEFNLRNMLCAIGIGIAHGEELGCMQKGLQDVKTVPGRLERIALKKTAESCPAVFVDYAHTPDALANVLTALLQLDPKRLVCVFGCGGDRDSGKRVLMGKIAGKLCDVVLATSDNPRSESPDMILAQIEAGLSRTGLKKRSAAGTLMTKNGRGYDILVNRRLAIDTAIRWASADDVILISGKGHENYQISRKGKIFFDDRVEAEMQLQARSGAPHAWKLEWVRQITGAQLLKPVEKSVTFKNISTDTRTIQAGDLFIALKGDNFDGMMFSGKAIEKGGAGLLINHTPGSRAPDLHVQPHVPVLLVPDTIVALAQLASSLRRWHNDLKVIAITGSSGKTTVKEMTAAILCQSHGVLKTEGNFNNLIGLPLTLFRLEPEHEIAVLEMGMNRPGEIASLTEIADPDVACIVNIQEAHLEGLGDIQGVAKAKNELFAGLKPEGKVAVNLDDVIVTSLAEALQQEKITFGCHPDAFVRAADIKSLGPDGMQFTLYIGNETRRAAIKALGRHNVTNSLAAAAMAHGVGTGIDDICSGLAAFKPYDKRARVEELSSGIMILNDCYNANPASMLAALNTLSDLKRNHRAVAVLADMLELGDKTEAAHSALGKAVHDLGLDFLAAFGSQAGNVVNAAIKAGMDPDTAKVFSSKQDLASWLQQLVQDGRIGSGDWFLIKGSRGMRMEEVLELLRNRRSTIKAAGN